MSLTIDRPFIAGEKPAPLTWQLTDSDGDNLDTSSGTWVAKVHYKVRGGSEVVSEATVNTSGLITWTPDAADFAAAGLFTAIAWAGNSTNRWASEPTAYVISENTGTAPSI
jgi:hypothetical protein